jgi:hypothetical protein
MNGQVRARVAGVMLLGLPGVARAQADRWEHAVGQYLAQAERRLHEAGYTEGESQLGVLNTDETDSFTMTLERGVAYVFTGVCDPDCVELQLALYAPNGYEVESARSAGSAPILFIDPRETASYRVQVVMSRCTTNPCRYGVGVFRKRKVNGT